MLATAFDEGSRAARPWAKRVTHRRHLLAARLAIRPGADRDWLPRDLGRSGKMPPVARRHSRGGYHGHRSRDEPFFSPPLAKSGTVVSSPCNRWAARTRVSIRAWIGCNATAACPTTSARVDKPRLTPSRAKRSACRFKGWCWPYLQRRAWRSGWARPIHAGSHGTGPAVGLSSRRPGK